MGRLIRKTDLPVSPPLLSCPDPALLFLLEARAEGERFIAQAKEDLVQLAVTMAGRLAGTTLALDAAQRESLYKDAVKRAGARSCVLRVHPQDATSTSLCNRAEDAGFDVVADESLIPGDCVVDAGGVTVDRRLSVLLSVMEEALRRRLP